MPSLKRGLRKNPVQPDPSLPLKNSRHEVFAVRVGVYGEGLAKAWGNSAEDLGKAPGTAAANAVSGSRANARPEVAARIAYLRRANAPANAGQPITRQSLHTLMEECTSALVQAADQAAKHGHLATATQIKRAIVTHAPAVSRP